MNLAELTDIELVEQFKAKHDERIVAELYRRYAKKVFWWALKILQNDNEAEDVVQEIFISFIGTTLDNYQVREDAKFSSWLYRCVGNQCFKILRARHDALNRQVNIDDAPQEIFAQIDLDSSMMLNEQTALLTAAINQLNAMQRNCCLKFYWEGKRYEEISAELGITYDQVRSNLQNGLRNLKLFFAEAKQKAVKGNLKKKSGE